ncbi:MAG: protease modulator HflK N-terminal domain-containing protein, partial [Parvibaculum sp.]
MPWSNQNGGGNGGWQGGGDRGPWGQPPKGGGGQQPPDLEDLIRKGQERLRDFMPGGGGAGAAGG